MLKVIYTVLSNRKYLAIAICSAIALMSLYVVSLSSVVLKTIGILTEKAMIESIFSRSSLQLAFISVSSILFGIWLSMQLFLKWEVKSIKAQPIITASGSVVGGFFGGVGALGGCPACLAIITGVIGANATAFLVQNSMPVILLSMALTTLSIYMTSKSINNKCRWCK